MKGGCINVQQGRKKPLKAERMRNSQYGRRTLNDFNPAMHDMNRVG